MTNAAFISTYKFIKVLYRDLLTISQLQCFFINIFVAPKRIKNCISLYPCCIYKIHQRITKKLAYRMFLYQRQYISFHIAQIRFICKY